MAETIGVRAARQIVNYKTTDEREIAAIIDGIIANMVAERMADEMEREAKP